MAGNMIGYGYDIVMPSTAVTTAKTLAQLKMGAAAGDLVGATIAQITKLSSELLSFQVLRKSAAATVTSATPLKQNPGDPASLAIGSTSGTGYNATAEGTNGDILGDFVFNVLNGLYEYLPVPEARKRIPQTGIIAVKLNTAPAASMNFIVTLNWLECI